MTSLFPSSTPRSVRRLAGGSALALLLLAGCGRAPAVEREPLPEFSLASLGGDRLTKKDLQGKVVLLDFWATWCGPCHLQGEILAELYPAMAKRGVEFVAISIAEDEETVRDFVARRPFPYSVLIDPDEALAGPLEVAALPTLVVIDAEGGIAWRHTGVADAEAIDAALRAAAAAGG